MCVYEVHSVLKYIYTRKYHHNQEIKTMNHCQNYSRGLLMPFYFLFHQFLWSLFFSQYYFRVHLPLLQVLQSVAEVFAWRTFFFLIQALKNIQSHPKYCFRHSPQIMIYWVFIKSMSFSFCVFGDFLDILLLPITNVIPLWLENSLQT